MTVRRSAIALFMLNAVLSRPCYASAFIVYSDGVSFASKGAKMEGFAIVIYSFSRFALFGGHNIFFEIFFLNTIQQRRFLGSKGAKMEDFAFRFYALPFVASFVC